MFLAAEQMARRKGKDSEKPCEGRSAKRRASSAATSSSSPWTPWSLDFTHQTHTQSVSGRVSGR